jgi:hypothetical protein
VQPAGEPVELCVHGIGSCDVGHEQARRVEPALDVGIVAGDRHLHVVALVEQLEQTQPRVVHVVRGGAAGREAAHHQMHADARIHVA